jgi:hypothetical protein
MKYKATLFKDIIKEGQVEWCMLTIPATQDAEAGGWQIGIIACAA